MDIADSTTSQLHAWNLISGVLNGPPSQLTGNLKLGDIPGWDSVAMVRLVVAIEERLDRQLTDSDIESIETVADVERLVTAHRPL
jgi:acyl carrier protein